MMMFNAHSYKQYRDMALSTLAPGELLVKLYDELVKQMRVAVLALEGEDGDLAREALTRAGTILDSLESYLDMSHKIAGSCRDLYAFLSAQLALALEEKNPAGIEELIPLVRELRESFDQADKDSRRHKAK